MLGVSALNWQRPHPLALLVDWSGRFVVGYEPVAGGTWKKVVAFS